jgi:hypothetical protein
MIRLLQVTITALLLSAPAAFPQAGLGPVNATLEGQGFTVTRTTREANRVTIQALRGNESRELVYDTKTGKLLSDDVMPLRDRDQDQDQLRDGSHDGEPDQDRDRDMDHTQDMSKDQDHAQDGSGRSN